MHDVDRTTLETGWAGEAYAAEEGYEFEPEYEPEMEPEYDAGEFAAYGAGEIYEGEAPFSEEEEVALATELLGITSDQELDQFLGKVFRRVARGVGRAIRSPVGRSLIGALRGVARQYLPVAGAALGNVLVPGLGGVVGGKLASAAGRAFGLEVEGLSAEDQEFQVARRYVRLAGDAARRAALASATGASPQAVVQQALTMAARRHAPGLVGRGIAGRRGVSGTWRRQGRVVVLYGV